MPETRESRPPAEDAGRATTVATPELALWRPTAPANGWARPTPGRAALATVVVLLVALAFWFLWAFRSVALTVAAGVILHIAIMPTVERLGRHGVSRRVAVTLVYALALLVVAGLVAALAPIVGEQISAVSEQVPRLYGTVRNAALVSELDLLPRLARQLPPAWDMGRLGQMVAGGLAPGAQGSAWQVLGTLGSGTFHLLVAFGLGYALTLHRERIVATALSRTSTRRRDELRSLIDDVEERVGQFVRGQLILCVIIGVASAAVYWAIGVPHALVLGLVAGVLEAVPMIGPVLTAVPAAILAATVGPQTVLWTLIAVAVIQTLEANVIVPRVMDRAVGVSPLVSVLALTALGLIFGIPGALLAIPLAAIVQILLDRWIFRDREGEAGARVPAGGAPEGGGETASVANRSHIDHLRVQAAELAGDARKQMRSIESPAATLDAPDDELADLVELTAHSLSDILAQASANARQPWALTTLPPGMTLAQPGALHPRALQSHTGPVPNGSVGKVTP